MFNTPEKDKFFNNGIVDYMEFYPDDTIFSVALDGKTIDSSVKHLTKVLLFKLTMLQDVKDAKFSDSDKAVYLIASDHGTAWGNYVQESDLSKYTLEQMVSDCNSIVHAYGRYNTCHEVHEDERNKYEELFFKDMNALVADLPKLKEHLVMCINKFSKEK